MPLPTGPTKEEKPNKFDVAIAQRMVHTARAQERLPGGELFVRMADMMELAVNEIRGVNDRTREFNIALEGLRRELRDEREEFRLFKADSVGFDDCVETLKKISGGAKGAKTLAADMLTRIAPKPAAPDEIQQPLHPAS